MIVNKQLAESSGHLLSDLWRTPPHVFNPLNEQFGFDLDPCCTEESALCDYFFTPKDNGLTRSWRGLTAFCNPPYSRGNIDLWVEKCYREALYDETVVVALLPVSSSSRWWHKWIVGKASLIYVERRIRFIDAPFTAPFSSVIALFGGNETGSFNQRTGKILFNSDQNLEECDTSKAKQ